MIKVNGYKIKVEHFPDGTQRIKSHGDWLTIGDVTDWDVEWHYKNDSELVTLMFVVNHIREHYHNAKIRLYMPYVPNARMDRTKNASEFFTLKYFANIINSLDFQCVTIVDPHSNVTPALFNRVNVVNAAEIIKANLEPEAYILYFPDASAAKKYSEGFPHCKYLYGEKKRDWSTGQILGLEIKNPFEISDTEIKQSNILIIDDIISYGGSMYYSILELEKMGIEGTIDIYASHLEESFFDEEKGTLRKLFADNPHVETLYTTDSIDRGVTASYVTEIEV